MSSAHRLLPAARDAWRDPRVRWAIRAVAIAYLAIRWNMLLTSSDPILAADARTYWGAPYEDPYSGPDLGLPGAYLYSPAFIQILAPFRLLPWEGFHAIWAALGFTALVYLVGPVGGAVAINLPFVYRDLLVGNIHLLLAATIVIGLRHPAMWAFPVLTKITPGIGLLWFAGRAEWRQLTIAVGATATVSVLSFAIAPELWLEWITRLRGDTRTAGDLYVAIIGVRLAVAAGIVIYASRSGRAWLVPLAVVLALPILWPDSLAILLACFPLIRAPR